MIGVAANVAVISMQRKCNAWKFVRNTVTTLADSGVYYDLASIPVMGVTRETLREAA